MKNDPSLVIERGLKVLANERREAILRAVERQGSITVKALAEEMGVSAVTLRQDVRELAGQGLLNRVHGGATALAPDASAPVPAEASAPVPVPAGEKYAVGLVVPPGGYYYAEVIRGVQNAARARGVRVVLTVSGESLAENQEQVRRLVAGGIDSLLLMLHPGLRPLEEAEQWLSTLEVPAVLVERRAGIQAGRLEQVASDHAYGAALAVRHLAGLGHDKVALVARIESPNTALLSAGHAEAVKAMGLTPGPEFLISTTGDAAPADARFEEVVRAVESGEVRAALVHNDIDAIALVGILRARGLRVPEDLAVVTYDDEVAELSDVPLTAVAPPKQAVGAWALDLAVRRLSDPATPLAEILLRPELRVRASCGADRRSDA
ncbi:substrate-binding domain-containing protein [Streptomyces poriferorum]|uniref:Substrate-binding domain-containing protein n=1 Tax=Streptomyces poriferorum TaxID=2798799 RepID=A0ABY9IK90_9ACTN|nr:MULTISPECIES: substrate-binding domain-containing protein [unclassified Streptomyces]MDP5316987.1 substrate-binding domain-containing protein [Streptomyces sp. Alt4]WLQ51985.1 substrate-binding domain-containing protein [Streptomyces sp. Alt1]WLQ55264.1 substrate-binding domain-containing protein [Streptomyces sp. Alt2]WSI66853.1 substrate-binding domain-containing protein [Streptomyces sp. NBC_01336]